MIFPILASDFTGAMEGLIWFFVNALVALAIVIVWLMLIFRKTRAAAIEQLSVLVRCGWALLLVVGLQVYPNLFERRPPDWESFFWLSGISLVLFLGAWMSLRLFRDR